MYNNNYRSHHWPYDFTYDENGRIVIVHDETVDEAWIHAQVGLRKRLMVAEQAKIIGHRLHADIKEGAVLGSCCQWCYTPTGTSNYTTCALCLVAYDRVKDKIVLKKRVRHEEEPEHYEAWAPGTLFYGVSDEGPRQ